MRAGPKRAVDDSVLPFRPRSNGTAAFVAFSKKFIRVPKGTGALLPLAPRDWQCELVGSVLDAPERPRVAGWCLPRGQGKSTLIAALGLYELMTGGEGATVIVAAVDERQAGIVFGVAARMVELNDELSSRIQVFKDRLVVPSRGASFHCLPASPASLEGLDYTLAIVDECGRVVQETWEVIALAQGKRERSTLIGIGTPGPNNDSVLARLRAYSLDNPEDTSQVYREYSAASFEDHRADCEHCWELANPALDDFLHRDALRALLPPKMTEAHFRRARLCQFVGPVEDAFVTAEVWDGLNAGRPVADGAEVIVALDGSFGGAYADTTAILVGTISASPHFDRVRVWASDGTDEYRVPLLEVEDAIRQACKRWRVREVVADPYRLTRTLQILADEHIPVAEFPHTPSRLTAATTDLYTAAVNGRMSHSGDEVLRRHVLAATLIESDKGLRLGKASRQRTAPKIDLAACMVMCHSRATWLASNRKPKRTMSFKN
ncbi:phage terminase [Mycobacteroides abscessus subsp. abscessus]|uniref:Phage terminase n=2 Tax=Mycobacteroides abscessus TaxID=36809 RepID=A0AB33T1W6_9MYCO|nr:terminase large subunit [Mycobacteroides abscessus]MDO3015307.1 terminase large subunit [Mycobacteroides abscessus subsp. abscessus]MDO3085860.1 terminase large subunit [Mycobacteroides abscessus subsp. abscessus]MDO3315769.1 terminase large subunit [Mycobacteroides abscessus subsp. abscessus]MDO3343050.1 terminase large subunit [Mycobacteroides abscessus subsp. abscessus]PVB17165.1 terminase [Mycobacteroides abscessus]